MAYDGWLEVDDTEFVNLSRTAQLAEVLGIDTVWITPSSVAWIQTALGGVDYDDITEAPWYDASYPASAEFAGLVPLSMSGLDDSTLERTVTEYITDGGATGKGRNKTLPIVAGMAVIASTARGADYGARWMNRVLRGSGVQNFCSGYDLTYFRWPSRDGEAVQKAHRRDVAVTRAASVTRKRITDCSATWWVTFTWTASDPYEYGVAEPQFTALGGTVTGPGKNTSGSLSLVQTACPVFNYRPIYDPLYPALVDPPAVPDFYPAGWDITDGDSFTRYWTRLYPVEPTSLNLVPLLTLTTTTEARMVRVSIWPSESTTSDQCDPLFCAILTYLPTGSTIYIDGEQKACYAWDGVSPIVRRADSLVYGTDAVPLEWTAFNDPSGLLVTLDIFASIGGGGAVRAALSLIPRSD